MGWLGLLLLLLILLLLSSSSSSSSSSSLSTFSFSMLARGRSIALHGKGNKFQWFLCVPTACLLSQDNTIMPIADLYFLSEAQCQKYTLSDLVKQVDHVDPKHTTAQQVVTIGALCYPMVGHLRQKDTPYHPYKRSLYALTYKGDSFLFFPTGSAKGVWL